MNVWSNSENNFILHFSALVPYAKEDKSLLPFGIARSLLVKASLDSTGMSWCSSVLGWPKLLVSLGNCRQVHWVGMVLQNAWTTRCYKGSLDLLVKNSSYCTRREYVGWSEVSPRRQSVRRFVWLKTWSSRAGSFGYRCLGMESLVVPRTLRAQQVKVNLQILNNEKNA